MTETDLEIQQLRRQIAALTEERTAEWVYVPKKYGRPDTVCSKCGQMDVLRPRFCCGCGREMKGAQCDGE